MKIVPSVLLLLALAAAAAQAAPAPSPGLEGWRALISDYAQAPDFLLAVDKASQRLSAFEHKSPLSKIAEYDCTTGQNHGDKLAQGDMKTPEGVYFVVSHISSGLDYALYGNEAYPLNYPNPVDRLRRKTGGGIWIHGKGVSLLPFDSNGCVGMNNQDLAAFKGRLAVGRPVLLALDIAHNTQSDAEKSKIADELAAKVEGWAEAWSGRSADFFAFYNPEAYSLAQGLRFSAFRGQKEALFKSLPWIRTTVSDIHALEGPGYWVTWFNQRYLAPNLRSSGTRRLYWQADATGELRIVGMEWLQNLRTPPLYAEIGARAEIGAGLAPALPVLSDASGAAPGYVPGASSGDASGATSPLAMAPPPPAPAAPAAPAGPTVKDATQNSEDGARAFIQRWREAWLRMDEAAYSACYAEQAVQDTRRGRAAIAAHKKKLWAAAQPLRLELSEMRLEFSGSGLKAVMRQEYKDSKNYTDYGLKTLYLEFDQGWRIRREEWSALKEQGL